MHHPTTLERNQLGSDVGFFFFFSLEVFLNSVCKCFVENFYIYVHQRKWSAVFLFVLSLFVLSLHGVDVRVKPALQNEYFHFLFCRTG